MCFSDVVFDNSAVRSLTNTIKLVEKENLHTRVRSLRCRRLLVLLVNQLTMAFLK
jgi:hypothetical protein